MNLREEFELQRFVSHLDTLRQAAASEFKLKEPFANTVVERIIQSTDRMLDAFHAMNIAMSEGQIASEGEADLLRFTAEERLQLCTRISHLFQGERLVLVLWSSNDNCYSSSVVDEASIPTYGLDAKY